MADVTLSSLQSQEVLTRPDAGQRCDVDGSECGGCLLEQSGGMCQLHIGGDIKKGSHAILRK